LRGQTVDVEGLDLQVFVDAELGSFAADSGLLDAAERRHSELLILGAKAAGGKVIVLSPRSEVAVGEPTF